jgi:hypothetical protein
LTVTDGHEGAPAPYSVTLSAGHAAISEHSPERPDAAISGTTDAWVQAFSPGGDRGKLRITGNRDLADALLDELALSSGREFGEQAEAAAS